MEGSLETANYHRLAIKVLFPEQRNALHCATPMFYVYGGRRNIIYCTFAPVLCDQVLLTAWSIRKLFEMY